MADVVQRMLNDCEYKSRQNVVGGIEKMSVCGYAHITCLWGTPSSPLIHVRDSYVSAHASTASRVSGSVRQLRVNVSAVVSTYF